MLLLSVVSAIPLDLNTRTYDSPSNYENGNSALLFRRKAAVLPCAADLYCQLLNETGAATRTHLCFRYIEIHILNSLSTGLEKVRKSVQGQYRFKRVNYKVQ